MNHALEKNLQKAQLLHRQGKSAASIELCRKTAKRFSKYAEPFLLIASIEQGRGNVDATIYALDQACQRVPTDLRLAMQYGDYCFQSGKYQQAAQVYKKGLAKQPSDDLWKTRLACALQESPNTLDKAVELHREVLAKQESNGDAHYNLGVALKRQHEFEAALAAYRRAAELKPKDVEVHYAVANLLCDLEQYEQAVDALNAVLALEPKHAEALEWLFYANKKLMRSKACVQAAEQLVDVTQNHPESLASLASAYITDQQYGLAIEQCDKSLAAIPANRRVWSDKTIALSGLGDKAKAQTLFGLDKLLYVANIEAPAGFSSLADFNLAIMEHVVNHPSLRVDGICHSCRGGLTSDEIFVEPLGPVGLLQQTIGQHIESYRQQLANVQGHPWVDLLPEQSKLEPSGWVTRLSSQGFQQGHIHPTGWISGVYYIHLPQEVGGDQQAGCIEFGRNPLYYPEGDQGDLKVVEPMAGTLVFFPSYFYHRTIPFESEQQRWTLAFDFRTEDFS